MAFTPYKALIISIHTGNGTASPCQALNAHWFHNPSRAQHSLTCSVFLSHLYLLGFFESKNRQVQIRKKKENKEKYIQKKFQIKQRYLNMKTEKFQWLFAWLFLIFIYCLFICSSLHRTVLCKLWQRTGLLYKDLIFPPEIWIDVSTSSISQTVHFVDFS